MTCIPKLIKLIMFLSYNMHKIVTLTNKKLLFFMVRMVSYFSIILFVIPDHHQF